MNRLPTLGGLATGDDDVAVVRDLDLHVDSGEIVALLGANGAGKTTTLLCVSAINPILGGDVELFGESIRGTHNAQVLARRGLADVLEDRALLSRDMRHGQTP